MLQAQQAFIRNRDISNANVAIAEGYFRGVERKLLRFWLLLDCTKGYNYLSWNWLERVLARAGLPEGLLRAVLRLVKDGNSVILKFLNHTCNPLPLHSGVAQGCPLSCLLYVIAVDPFLEYVATRIPDVGIVAGFCDDWTVECLTCVALHAVQAAGEEFEQASGQLFNRSKSKVLPTAGLDQHTAQTILIRWHSCPIVSVAKILGLWIGYAYSPRDLGQETERKYCSRMNALSGVPSTWAGKIVMLNVFLRSLWSYVNRHVLIPTEVRLRVERRDLDFLTKVPYMALGSFSHITPIYGIRVRLLDFQLANIAGLIATATAIQQYNGAAAALIQEAARDTEAPSHALRPSHAFATAYAFYFHTVGDTVDNLLSGPVFHSTRGENLSVFRAVYQRLVLADRRHWREYWCRRVTNYGFNPSLLENALLRIPASVAQADRWNLMKIHLNAISTASRIRFVQGVDGDHACWLCGAGDDSLRHIFGDCAVVSAVKRTLDCADWAPREYSWENHCLLNINDSDISKVLKLNGAMLRARSLCKRQTFHGPGDIIQHVCEMYRNPGLRGATTAMSREKRRRTRRIPLPDRSGYALYRVAGVAGVSEGRVRQPGSAWGAIFLGPAGSAEQAADYNIASSSANICCYHGILECLGHALRNGDQLICIQISNMLVAKQVNYKFACRSMPLRALLAAVWEKVHLLEARMAEVTIEQIERVDNQTACQAATRALTTRRRRIWAP